MLCVIVYLMQYNVRYLTDAKYKFIIKFQNYNHLIYYEYCVTSAVDCNDFFGCLPFKMIIIDIWLMLYQSTT